MVIQNPELLKLNKRKGKILDIYVVLNEFYNLILNLITAITQELKLETFYISILFI